MLDLLTSGLSVVFAPKMFLLLIFAVFLGTLFGALPGVSATMAVTLGIPFTYRMTPVDAIAFLVAIYCASVTGGGMTAILFKIPGVPSSAPTTYDGYPLKVEYYLTDRGRKIFEAVTIMQSVGIDMMTEDGREDFLREKGLL